MTKRCPESSEKSTPGTGVCPIDSKPYALVKFETLLHHIKNPNEKDLKQQGYYFCSSPDCNVVYFGEDKSIITRDELHQDVGQKSDSPDRILCYCFNITYATIMDEIKIHGFSPSKRFVEIQTKSGSCTCKTKNPSGKCCLRDFPKDRKNG